MKPFISNIFRAWDRVELCSLSPALGEEFYQIISDKTVTEYFQAFRNTKEQILNDLPDIIGNIATEQHWLIKMDDAYVGYVAMKRSVEIFDLLYPEPSLSVDDETFLADLDLSKQELEEKNRVARANKKAVAPYRINIAVSVQARGQQIATKALICVLNELNKRGEKEVYLEVHHQNLTSNNWVKNTLGAITRFDDNQSLTYPATLFKYPTTVIEQLDRAWRHLNKCFAGLEGQKTMIEDIFLEFIVKGVGIDFTAGQKSCFFSYHYFTDPPGKTLKVATEQRDEPHTIIWSLFHEYGHMQQAPPTDAEKIPGSPERLSREEGAWQQAEIKLINYPFYLENQRSYERYKAAALLDHAHSREH